MSNNEHQDHRPPTLLSDSALQDRLARLSRERQGGDDLWPQIQARLEPQPTKRALAWIRRAAAAGFVLAIAASLIINLGISPSNDTERLSRHAGNLPLLSASAELEYSGALQNLLPLTVSAAVAQPGTLLADYERSLEVVRAATDAVRVALASDPGSRYLNDMLADLHYRQLNVLKAMARHADQQSPEPDKLQVGLEMPTTTAKNTIRSTS